MESIIKIMIYDVNKYNDIWPTEGSDRQDHTRILYVVISSFWTKYKHSWLCTRSRHMQLKSYLRQRNIECKIILFTAGTRMPVNIDMQITVYDLRSELLSRLIVETVVGSMNVSGSAVKLRRWIYYPNGSGVHIHRVRSRDPNTCLLITRCHIHHTAHAFTHITSPRTCVWNPESASVHSTVAHVPHSRSRHLDCLSRCRLVPPPPRPPLPAPAGFSQGLSGGWRRRALRTGQQTTPDTRAEKFESLERINAICEVNWSFDSCSSCKRLAPKRFDELLESKLPFVSRIEFIHLKLLNFSAHVSEVTVSSSAETIPSRRRRRRRRPVTRPPRSVRVGLL